MPKKKGQNIPRRHHIIPSSYLKRFCDASGMLSGLIISSGKVFNAKPADVAFERDRNMQTIDGEPDPRVEIHLGSVEQRGAEYMRDVDRGVFPFADQDKRSVMSLYLALLYSRTDAARDRTKEAIAALSRATHLVVTPEWVAKAIRKGGGEGDPTAEELSRAEAARQQVSNLQAHEFQVDNNYHIDSMLRETNNLFPFFANRNWRIFRFERPVLATNDNPIILVRNRKLPLEWGVGVGTARYIVFVLDPCQCLVLSNTDFEEGIFNLSLNVPDAVETVTDINDANWRQASKFVFRHPGYYPLGQWKPLEPGK